MTQIVAKTAIRYNGTRYEVGEAFIVPEPHFVARLLELDAASVEDFVEAVAEVEAEAEAAAPEPDDVDVADTESAAEESGEDFPPLDADGVPFDPDIHAQHPDGSPKLKKDGTWWRQSRPKPKR